MILFSRFELKPRGHLSVQPPSLSWDYLTRGHLFEHDLALITCVNGHTLRMVAEIHRVQEDGTVWPSWVCVHPGCSFHAFIRLVGWNSKEK